jgi:hypothetical protein
MGKGPGLRLNPGRPLSMDTEVHIGYHGGASAAARPIGQSTLEAPLYGAAEKSPADFFCRTYINKPKNQRSKT